MKLFQINFNNLTIQLLPTFMRQPVVMAFVRAAMQPVFTLVDRFNISRNNNIYNLQHNGQRCYLRSMLNDAFDPDQRRITIDDTIAYDWLYIYPESADQPLWLETRLIASLQYTGIEGTDFTVFCNGACSVGSRPQMVALLNYYKLAGKRYSIIFN